MYFFPTLPPPSCCPYTRRTDTRSKGEDQKQTSETNSESTLHCCKAHFAKSTESDFKHRQKKKKNPKPWDWNSNIHGQEIIHKTRQKWAEKLHSQAATCNSPDRFFVTALDNDQTRKSIRWHMKEALQHLHLSVSYFMGLFEFSYYPANRWQQLKAKG